MSRGSFEDPKSERPHGLKNDWSWSLVASIVFNSAIIITLLYGFGICLGTINATLMPVNEYCLHTVSTSYNYLTFAGEGYGSFFGPTCLNPLRITSTYASGKTFCTEREIDVGFEKIRKDCEKRDYEFLDWRKVVANITDDDVVNMRVVEFEDVPSIGNLTEPVLLSKPFYQRVGNTLVCHSP